MENLLGQEGFKVEKASNGAEAVSLLSKRNEMIEKLTKREKKNVLNVLHITTEVEELNQNPESECLYWLIFLDINMPVMDGFEACSKMNEMMEQNVIPYIPIIACTGEDQADLQAWKQRGFADVLPKPVTKEKLKILLKKFI